MRWIGLILAMLIFFVGVHANSVSMELAPSNLEVNVGDQFNLTLLVKNIPEDRKCAGLDAEIHYDSNLLNLVDIQLSDIANSASLKKVNVDEGTLSLLWFSNSPYGNFTVATFVFKKIAPGETKVSVSGTISDNDGYKYNNIVYIPAIITDSNTPINESDFILFLPNATIGVNETATLPIMLNTSEPLGSLQFRIYYDPNIINVTKVESSAGMIQANIGYGYVEVGIINANGFSSGEIAKITITGLSNGTTILDGELIDASDVKGNEKCGILVPGELQVRLIPSFELILPNASLRVDKVGKLPLILKLNTTEPLGSLQFRIYYNPDIINITNVTSNVGMIQANIGYGFVEVGIISVNGFGSGEVAEITVAGLSNGTTILDGELIDASDVEGNYKYGIIVPGVLNVYKRKPGDANGDDKITAVDALIYLRFAVGLDITPYKLDPVADDMTGDGKITATDALKVLRIAVGLE